MKEFVTVGYSYSELDDEAKEKVKQWYLEDDVRVDIFYEDIINDLKDNFPNSKLDVIFSLAYCQGDGLNIVGKLNLFDYLEKWEADEKEKKRMDYYLSHSGYEFHFKKNNHYCYSCKFIDKKYIADYIADMCSDLRDNCVRKIDEHTIEQFFTDMLDYFEELDKKFEKEGYTYLYEVEDDEISETCEINEWYFTKEGEFIR